MTTHPAALRLWSIPVVSTAVAMIVLLVILRAAGVLSSQPLEETQLVFSLKWGLIIAFILQLVLTWRGHRKYSVTATSLASIPEPGSSKLPEHLRALDKAELTNAVVLARTKARGVFMMGNVTAALVMLAGLYVITKSAWVLLAIAFYAVFSAWAFRPMNVAI